MGELHFFDPNAEYSVFERRLPHWSQPGVVCFITWRTYDSLAASVIEQWRNERYDWLRRHGIIPRSADWRERLHQLGREKSNEFFSHFSKRWHDHLDDCHGLCLLKSPNLAAIVAESLRKFDGDRYDLADFVIMPNHVHILCTFHDQAAMLEQCENWKRFQSTQINKATGSSGRFWQQDGFDHLVRSQDQFESLRRYVANNPTKARLAPGSYVHWSKPLG